jgi:lysophospholipase L1-like esterase
MRYERLSRRVVVWALCAVVIFGVASASFAVDTVLSMGKGQRMVFLGDSITDQRIYTRFVMDYYALRYPDCDVSFRNAGWGGDTAPKALDRLQRDVLSLKPNVVSICLGMNDAEYGPFNQETFDRYITGMQAIISLLKKANVKVVLLTPGCIDEDQRDYLKGYNDTLRKFADGILDLAKKDGLPVYNIHTLMLDVQTQAKKDDPNFTMIPDAVHPNDAGMLVMAYGLLKALGCTDGASRLAITALDKKAFTDKCEVRELKFTETSISFYRKDNALPMYFAPGAQAVLKYAPIVDDLSKYQFKITGLKTGSNWKLTVDGIETGTFSAKELADGVNLTMYPGPWQALGEAVDNMVWNQEQMYFIKWREFEVGPLADDAKKMLAASVCPQLDDVIDKWEKSLHKTVQDSREWKWELTLVQ